MSKFKVGDRVKVKEDSGWFDLEGLSGTLVQSDNDMYLHLKLDTPPDDDLRDFFPVLGVEIEHLNE